MSVQKISLTVMQIVFVITALITSGCSGGADNQLSATGNPDKGAKVTAKLVGGSLQISTAPDDQQNPQVIYLADKNIYFTVWEDWRNRNSTGADIYGKFLNPDGTACGSEFVITNNAANQTVPSAAYKPGGKIAVVWQNSEGLKVNKDLDIGYVQYAGISSIPTGNACTSVTPVVGEIKDAGYTPVKVFAGNTPQLSPVKVAFTNVSGATGPFLGMLSPTEPKNIAGIKPTTVKITQDLDQNFLKDDGLGKLIGPEGSGTVNYVTGEISITRTDPAPKAGIEYSAVWESYNSDSADRKDKLLSRKSPKIIYDSPRDQFWVAWNESRDIINSSSVLCFGAAPVTWDFGDNTFAGYMKLNSDLETVKSISYPSSNDSTITNTTTGPEIIRNDATILNRLISRSATATTETYTYEFFTALNTPTLASDTSSPETFFAWEGVRNKGVLTCTLDSKTGIISSSFASSSYDDGKLHIYGLFDKEFYMSSFNSKWVDNENKNTASNPTVTVDSVSVPRKFLVAWEDNRDGANTKIYGQLVNSGGGLYNTNKIISFSDTNADDAQDANVANSRQTKPVISFDSVNQRYFVMWQDGRNGSISLENLDIFGQYIDLEGSLRGGNYAITTASGSQIAPALGYSSLTNQFLAVWKDASNTTGSLSTASDIIGQIFSLGQPQMTLLKTDNSSLEPALIDFGSVIANQIQRVSFKLRNSGDTTLSVDCISPLPNSPFSFENLPTEINLCAEGKTLDLSPSGETTLTVKISPTSGGTFTGSFTLKSDGGDRTVNLQGIGIPPTMTLSEGDGANEGTLNYANVETGQTKDITLTVTNNSSVTYNITSIQGIDSPFSLVNPPTFPVAMAPSATLQLSVRYAPTVAGNNTAQLTINTDKSLSQTVNLVGTGTATGGTTPPPPPDTGGGTGGGTGTNNPAPTSGGKSGCFIATAAYGSYLDPHVMVLRHFRDKVLLQSKAGTAFVKFYYTHSPPIADYIAQHETLRLIFRLLLTPIILLVKLGWLTPGALIFALGICLYHKHGSSSRASA